MSSRLVAALVVGRALSACSSFSTSVEVTDAAADATMADVADAGPVNLLSSGDFENVTDGHCGVAAGWMPTNGNTALTSAVAHGGRFACVVCSTVGATRFSLNAPAIGPAVVGRSFHFRAFVRRAANGALPVSVDLVPRISYSGAPERDGESSTAAITADGWTQIDADYTVGDEVTSGEVGSYLDFASDGNPSSCAIVDDYEAWATN